VDFHDRISIAFKIIKIILDNPSLLSYDNRMKIELNLEQLEAQKFSIKKDIIAGETVVLVNPYGFPTWTKENMIFRSSVWTLDGKPVSLAFKKFFNLTEAPQLTPDPTEKDLKTANIIAKLDGSLLAVSTYKGQLIHRTRGTFNAENLDNGFEIDILKEKYPQAFDNKWVNSEEYTLIFEWLSDTNRIILLYPDCPDIKLVGCVKHSDYMYFTQKELDELALEIKVSRPYAASFKSMEDVLKSVEDLKEEEGFCIYFNGDQDIKKVKSPWYLALHRFKSNCNIEHILDFYLECGQPKYNDFVMQIEKAYDFECLKMALPFASKVCDAGKEVQMILAGMRAFIEKIRVGNPSRKMQAQEILSSYGETNRGSYLFQMLDGREINKEGMKKLYFQVLKYN
jgi:hypothetical protein